TYPQAPTHKNSRQNCHVPGTGTPRRMKMWTAQWEFSRQPRQMPPEAPLLVVTEKPARMLDIDLRAAGIPKYTPEGKVDCHALRVAYVTFIFKGGATPPEARELARHRHPELTLEVYARTRTARLQTLVDEVALTIIPMPSVHRVCT